MSNHIVSKINAALLKSVADVSDGGVHLLRFALRSWPAGLAIILGSVILFGTGFAPGYAHNTAHDMRHTMIFPCH